MSETWVVPEKFNYHPNKVEGYFLVPKNSSWFSGHFPNDPILPGIAFLGMVQDTLRAYTANLGERIVIKELKRIRFRQIVRPETRLTITITLNSGADSRRITFECIVDNSKACDGTIMVDKV